MTLKVYLMPALKPDSDPPSAAYLESIRTASNPPFISKKELARDLGVGCRTIEKWVAERLIPFIRGGHRTLKFVLDDVRRALRRWTVKEVQ